MTISGRLNKDYYDEEDRPARSFETWGEIKPLFLQAVKGKRQPLGFKIVFMLPDDNKADIIIRNNLLISPEDVAGMYFNIHFERGELLITSGTSLRVFTPDRTVEQMWDDAFLKFLNNHGIYND